MKHNSSKFKNMDADPQSRPRTTPRTSLFGYYLARERIPTWVWRKVEGYIKWSRKTLCQNRLIFVQMKNYYSLSNVKNISQNDSIRLASNSIMRQRTTRRHKQRCVHVFLLEGPFT